MSRDPPECGACPVAACSDQFVVACQSIAGSMTGERQGPLPDRVFDLPSASNPVIYARSWFSIPQASGPAPVAAAEPAPVSVEQLTARLQELHVQRSAARTRCANDRARPAPDAAAAGAPGDDDDDFEENFGRELNYLLAQLRLHDANGNFMPYIY
ncbi:Uncharacterized protein PBTT_06767 [Plasmodiophora brassicae]|uniref:Uncharacterized protein n=1 Tax=Plasmodiophora brassicae TaxID=37360 RepID=A0A0G4IVS1_PLABS|nr:hypothetical protein PBRA_001349 [Plasmodiophora brassicae]SPQ97450.1 unnamed protein product [Plasmodiophora brassicae]